MWNLILYLVLLGIEKVNEDETIDNGVVEASHDSVGGSHLSCCFVLEAALGEVSIVVSIAWWKSFLCSSQVLTIMG